MDSATINSQSSDDSDHSIVPYISLCSGYEGIGLGLGRCIKGLRAVAYCEREAFAISNLVAKMENGLLDAAPVFTDVSTFPWKQFAPFMAGGILSFGWPCQPVSTAGKRKATEDERWLFDIIADGIATLRPGMLFAENVEGLLSAKMPDGSSVFGHCIQRLERLHYKVAAGIFSASECGAPHQRKRVFILAYDSSKGSQGREWLREAGAQRTSSGHPIKCSGSMAISSSLGGAAGLSRQIQRHEGQSGEPDDSGYQAWPSRPGEQQYGWEPLRVVADGHRLDRSAQAEGREHDRQAGPAGEELGDAGDSRRDDWDKREQSIQVSCRGCGENNATDARQTQPPLGRDADGSAGRMDYAELCVSGDNRTDELRLLGNGVVPATAERAFRVLMKELYTAPAVS